MTTEIEARVADLLADRSIPYMARSHDGRPLAERDVYLTAPEAEGIAAVLAEAGLLADMTDWQRIASDATRGYDAARADLARVNEERDAVLQHRAEKAERKYADLVAALRPLIERGNGTDLNNLRRALAGGES